MRKFKNRFNFAKAFRVSSELFFIYKTPLDICSILLLFI